MYFDLGRYEEAREALRHHPQPTEDADYFENLDRILMALAAGEPAPPLTNLDERSAGMTRTLWPVLGRTDAYLDRISPLVLDAGWHGPLEGFSNPVVSPARKTERFKQLVQDVGLVDYWRERGWSDYCRPSGTTTSFVSERVPAAICFQKCAAVSSVSADFQASVNCICTLAASLVLPWAMRLCHRP